eukprot:CAMPEP_0171369868 /NCGR_PEP_ID=MMETSP0879-20121228/7641_1 /TAXON_ID=67004 /ORGANISM="Thalassiosira weissflogii, Strain CCMP1336" /LENGTH=272 /DNA_ID=CAMNT_0011878245 /DNA_START=23 /DNA_END=841 /DNA_ORIENTATION=-
MRFSTALSLSGAFLLSAAISPANTLAFTPLSTSSNTATLPKPPPSTTNRVTTSRVRAHVRNRAASHSATIDDDRRADDATATEESPSPPRNHPPRKPHPNRNDRPLRSLATTALLTVALSVSSFVLPISPANSADYASFTPSQRFLSELWRVVDASYLDRTFGSQNWFQLRQDAVYGKKYQSLADARAEADVLLSKLGDRYTRYLPPGKYDSIVNAATGNVFGVGVELASDEKKGRVIAGDVEATGPAYKAGLMPGDAFVEADGVRFDGSGV